jgi:hypothetical protein
MPAPHLCVQAANLLRALRQNKEAAGLGLLEGVKGERGASDIEVQPDALLCWLGCWPVVMLAARWSSPTQQRVSPLLFSSLLPSPSIHLLTTPMPLCAGRGQKGAQPV